jgi:hypothetical protein
MDIRGVYRFSSIMKQKIKGARVDSGIYVCTLHSKSGR